MDYKILRLEPWNLMGISIRTHNQVGKSIKDIGALWEKFMREDIFQKIPHKLGDSLYCLYTDYEDKDQGFYTTYLGARVSQQDIIPQGMKFIQIPALNYRVYTSRNAQADSILETWNYIWSHPIPRSFEVDFDLYDQAISDNPYKQVNTYISVNHA